MSLRIGTRGSRLALAQAETVAGLLAGIGVDADILPMATQGDLVTGVPLHEIGGQGVFVRALDEALLRGEIDCAVHSMKDIPAKRPPGLITAAVLKRDPPGDYLVHHIPYDEIRVIGTSSTRRRAQVLRYLPGTKVRPLRGNVDTRLRKLDEGLFDAIILAHAGLHRLGINPAGRPMPLDTFVPSVNQGTIAVVASEGAGCVPLIASFDDAETRRDIMIERKVMEVLGGGCFTPLGVYSTNGWVTAEVLSLDGSRAERFEARIGTTDGAEAFAIELLERAGGLIEEAYRGLGVNHGG